MRIEVSIQDRSRTIRPLGYQVVARYNFNARPELAVLRRAFDRFLRSNPDAINNNYLVARSEHPCGMEMSISQYLRRR